MGSARQAGSALLEALAALTLLAVAGGVVASSATASLRAVRRAIVLEQVVSIAARELSAVQSQGAPSGTENADLEEPRLTGGATISSVVTRRADGVAELSVTVDTPTTYGPVTLATHMLVAE